MQKTNAFNDCYTKTCSNRPSPIQLSFKRSDIVLNNQLLSPDWTECFYGCNSSQSNGMHIHVEECILAGVEVVDSFSNDYERMCVRVCLTWLSL